MPKETPPPTTGPTIHDAILAIYRDGKLYAQKANRNTQQSYNYVSEADFLALLRPQLAAHGVVVTATYEVIHQGEFATKSGGVMRSLTLVGTFTFTHAASGTSVNVVTVGEGTDQQDKAPYKAMTGALKYAMRQTFLVETGDDPEGDEKTDAPGNAPAPPKSKFIIDYEEQAERLTGNNLAGLKRKLKEFGLDPDNGLMDQLVALPGEKKRELIAALRAEPPF